MTVLATRARDPIHQPKTLYVGSPATTLSRAPRPKRELRIKSDLPDSIDEDRPQIVRGRRQNMSPRMSPRSKLGCWTCRTRKVKCDEARPTCTQCSRLGHECDYGHRLTFKDDTTRIVSRMSQFTSEDGTIWKAEQTTSAYQRPDQRDDLPPFANLTVDEDREKKAGHRKPGTYYVVANPGSFDGTVENDRTRKGSNCSVSPSPSVGLSPSSATSLASPRRDDPNVVILTNVEDIDHQETSKVSNVRNRPRRGGSATSASPSPSITDITRSTETISMRDRQDEMLLDYFKSSVARQLAQAMQASSEGLCEIDIDSLSDLLEAKAAMFPPLHHAILSFSALSLSLHHSKDQKLDVLALQHYQKVLPSLQTFLKIDSDLTSDGVFLTHFVLLVYEIAASGSSGSLSLWAQHLSRLQMVIALRKDLHITHPFDSIVRWVCDIDAFALLTGSGSGHFVKQVMAEGAMVVSKPDQTVANGSTRYLREIIQHRRLRTLAVEIGSLARQMRRKEEDSHGGHSPLNLNAQQPKIEKWSQQLRQMTLSTPDLGSDKLRAETQGLSEKNALLAHALNIYLLTCLFTSEQHANSIGLSSARIIQVAHNTLKNPPTVARRSLPFSLFMAGTVTRGERQRTEILGLLSAVGKDRILGENVDGLVRILKILYHKDAATARDSADDEEEEDDDDEDSGAFGHLDVHWLDLVEEMELNVVSSQL